MSPLFTKPLGLRVSRSLNTGAPYLYLDNLLGYDCATGKLNRSEHLRPVSGVESAREGSGRLGLRVSGYLIGPQQQTFNYLLFIAKAP